MTNRLGRVIAPAALIIGMTAAPLFAQTPAESNLPRGTELGGSVAAAVTSSDTAPALSGTAAWSVTRWVTVEARGSWFARGDNTQGFGADMGVLVNLVARRPVTPYVNAAFGLYHAGIDMPAPELSDFYRTRILAGQGGTGSTRTFTDPAWRFGGGVDVLRHRNISIRPEASVILVYRQGAAERITTVGVRLAYVFEDHSVPRSDH